VLLSRVIESAFEEGASEFDFLAGGERYKFRFANGERPVTSLTLAPRLPHPAAVVARAEHTGRRLGRTLSPELRRRLGLARLARGSLLRGRRR